MLFGLLLVPAIPAGGTGAVDALAASLCHNLVKFGGYWRPSRPRQHDDRDRDASRDRGLEALVLILPGGVCQDEAA
jgi:hypothetical protein